MDERRGRVAWLARGVEVANDGGPGGRGVEAHRRSSAGASLTRVGAFTTPTRLATCPPETRSPSQTRDRPLPTPTFHRKTPPPIHLVCFQSTPTPLAPGPGTCLPLPSLFRGTRGSPLRAWSGSHPSHGAALGPRRRLGGWIQSPTTKKPRGRRPAPPTPPQLPQPVPHSPATPASPGEPLLHSLSHSRQPLLAAAQTTQTWAAQHQETSPPPDSALGRNPHQTPPFESPRLGRPRRRVSLEFGPRRALDGGAELGLERLGLHRIRPPNREVGWREMGAFEGP